MADHGDMTLDSSDYRQLVHDIRSGDRRAASLPRCPGCGGHPETVVIIRVERETHPGGTVEETESVLFQPCGHIAREWTP